jgi:hypothetical protein
LDRIRAELLPEIIELFLRVAIHLKRDRFVKLEVRPAVQRRQRVSMEFERHPHHGAPFAPVNFLPDFPVPRDLRDLRVLENRGIKLRSFFSVAVEPKTRSHFLGELRGHWLL